jgi:hypothetical protein
VQGNSAAKSNFLLIGPWAAALEDSPSGRYEGIVTNILDKRARMALASVSSSRRESAAALGRVARDLHNEDVTGPPELSDEVPEVPIRPRPPSGLRAQTEDTSLDVGAVSNISQVPAWGCQKGLLEGK